VNRALFQATRPGAAPFPNRMARLNHFVCDGFAPSSFSPQAKIIFAEECVSCDGAKIVIFRIFRGFIPRKMLFASRARRDLISRESFVMAKPSQTKLFNSI
jgi:hypothetical protein